MSNAGLDRYLKTLNLSLARSAVGDRYVLEEMAKGGFNVGGEQSGHIILSDFSTTGDGLVAALQVLAVLAQEASRPARRRISMNRLPQVLENVRFKKGSPLDDDKVKSCIESANAKLGATGPHPGAQVGHRTPDPRHGRRRGRKGRARRGAPDRFGHRRGRLILPSEAACW